MVITLQTIVWPNTVLSEYQNVIIVTISGLKA